ncbi:hypothetical protein BBK36DRAFT_1085205, partial [Trichoderma citrinoviride]
KCATETHGSVEVRIGWDSAIRRWRKGSELRYIVCTDGFPPCLARRVEDDMKQAISAWQGIGVSFKQVSRDSKATFTVRYQRGIWKKAYACSFFPDPSPAELLVFEPTCSKPEYLPNILAHEIGHILGLRHEFALEKEGWEPSCRLGPENPQSIMQYYDHLGKYKVNDLDLQGLREFYEYDQEKYDGLAVLDIEPGLH